MKLKEIFECINHGSDSVKVCQETQKIVKNFTGFGYIDNDDIINDLYGRVKELEVVLNDKNNNVDTILNGMGRVVFVLCLLANKHEVYLDEALKQTFSEFQRRINYLENKIGNKKELDREYIIENWKEAKDTKK